MGLKGVIERFAINILRMLWQVPAYRQWELDVVAIWHDF